MVFWPDVWTGFRSNLVDIIYLLLCLQRLSEDCEEHIDELEEEAALDYRLNPKLAKECEKDVSFLVALFNSKTKKDLSKL